MTAIVNSAAPQAGFSDPVQQSQQAFRAILDAMAHPGLTITLATDSGHPPGLAPSLAAILLTLCDLDTPVLLGPGFADASIGSWLRFHTGAPLVADPQDAAIALLDARHMMPLDAFPLGSDEAPEKGATLLVQVDVLDGPAAMEWRGPGIRTVRPMPLLGLEDAVWRQRHRIGPAFPRGLDLCFGCGPRLIALPRSTTISFLEA